MSTPSRAIPLLVLSLLALSAAARAAKLQPQDREAWYHYANEAALADDWPALEDATRVYSQLAPEDPKAWANMAVSVAQQGRVEEATAPVDRAIQLNPREPEYHYMKGVFLEALKRNGEAAMCFEAALALKPDHALARQKLAAVRGGK